MPTTVNQGFASGANQTRTISDETTVNVDVGSFTWRANTLTLQTAAGTGPFTVTVNLANQVSGYTDKLIVGNGINLVLNSPGRWDVDASSSNSTNATFTGPTYGTATSPRFIGSSTGPNTVTVNANARVNEMQGGSGNDTVTIAGRVDSLATGNGNDTVTVSGTLTTLSMGSGTNTVNVTGSGSVGTLTAGAGGVNGITMSGSGSIDTLNLVTGTGATTIAMGANNKIGTISATGQVGAITLSGNGTVKSIATGAGNDVIHITDTDFDVADALNDQIATGAGNDSLTFTGVVSVKNSAATSSVVNTGTGDDSITVTTNSSLTLSGGMLNLPRDIVMGDGADNFTAQSGATVALGNLDMGAGNDTVSLTGANFTGNILTGLGDDNIWLTNTTLTGDINAGGGADTLSVTGGKVTGSISTGDGVDTVTLSGAQVTGDVNTGADYDSVTMTNAATIGGNLALGDGGSTVNITGGGVSGSISANVGIDNITLTNATVGGSIGLGDGNDSLTIGGGVVNGAINMGAGADNLSASNTVLRNNVNLGAGDDRFTAVNTSVQGVIDGGGGNDEIRITDSTTSKITAGDGNDTVVITGGMINGDIDMGDGTDSLTLVQSTIPTNPNLFEHYFHHPSVVVHGDIDLGSGGGIQTLNVGDGVLINGQITAGKLFSQPVTSHVTIGNYVTIDDSDFSISLGQGDDVVTIGNNSYINGQILLNAGNNTLHVGQGTWLSSSNTAIFGGSGDDHVTLEDNVVVKGSISLAAGNNTLLVGSNVTFTESGAVYASADTGEGGIDLLDFGSGVKIRGNIFTGWSNDIVSMTEGALASYDSGTPVVSGGLGGETRNGDLLGDVLIVGDFFDTGVLVGKYTYDTNLSLWFANLVPGTNHTLQEFTYNGVVYRYFETIKIVPTCFTPGTLIATAKGLRAVEDICVGDLIPTRDNGLQRVRKVLRTSFDAAHLAANPRHQPVRIAAGALGAGLPERDLIVSPQHRVLLRSRIAERVMGSHEVLTPAVQLVGMPGISRLTTDGVTYLHLVFDRHELIISEGAVTEAFYPGPAAAAGMDLATKREMAEIFPDFIANVVKRPMARPEIRGRIARDVLNRHSKNNKPLLAS